MSVGGYSHSVSCYIQLYSVLLLCGGPPQLGAKLASDFFLLAIPCWKPKAKAGPIASQVHLYFSFGVSYHEPWMLGIVALGVQCICPISPTTSTAPYLINQREGGEARAYCSLLSPGFSVKRTVAKSTTKLTALPNHCQTLLPFLRLITPKTLQGKSS